MCSLRSELSGRCQGSQGAVITQANTPVGSRLVYDGERKRSVQVSPEVFSTFAKVRGSSMPKKGGVWN